MMAHLIENFHFTRAMSPLGYDGLCRKGCLWSSFGAEAVACERALRQKHLFGRRWGEYLANIIVRVGSLMENEYWSCMQHWLLNSYPIHVDIQ